MARTAANIAFGVGALFALASCGDDGEFSAEDLASADVSDLAMSKPNDLSSRGFDEYGGCAGSNIAGTCVEAFFASFVSCFQPAGPCAENSSLSGTRCCWQDGARFQAPGPTGADMHTWIYDGSLGRCLTAYNSISQSVVLFCPPDEPSCGFNAQGVPTGGALYHADTGIFTCPDGTQVDVGSEGIPFVYVGNCSALNMLLNPVGLCDTQIKDLCVVP